MNSSDIILTNGTKIITVEEELVTVFDNHYKNIAWNYCFRKPRHIARDNNIGNITLDIERRTYFRSKSSVCKIKEHYSNNQSTMPCLSLTILEKVKGFPGAINPK